MSTYKLIQDIEAEDHILGPLTLRQFIFALIAVFLFYICFILITKHIYVMLAVVAPPALFFLFFALPWGRDQPTEIWFLAKLRFWFKPRQRVWNQSGVKELVTVTVPKKVERILTDGLSQGEVKSRLKALSSTLDTRGWAVKNVNDGNYHAFNARAMSGTDRLIGVDDLSQDVPDNFVSASDDILDANSNPIAQQFQSMIGESSKLHRQQLIDELNDVRQQRADTDGVGVDASVVQLQSQTPTADDNWFMGQSGAKTASPNPATGSGGVNDAALTAQLKAQADAGQGSTQHMKTLQPDSGQLTSGSAASSGSDSAATTVTPPSDPGILSLANNDDFNVATLAREAKRNKGEDDQSAGEVVVSLH